MNPQPLKTVPISVVVIGQMKPQYVIPARRYLERLGCMVTPLGGISGYSIQFPEGTVEETYAGQSTQWTHRTTIRFPGGVTLQKYVIVYLPQTSVSITTIAFPNEVLHGNPA